MRTAEVFLDLNKNLIKDGSEQSIETDSSGNFSIEPSNGTDGYLVSSGGIDNISSDALPSDMFLF